MNWLINIITHVTAFSLIYFGLLQNNIGAKNLMSLMFTLYFLIFIPIGLVVVIFFIWANDKEQIHLQWYEKKLYNKPKPYSPYLNMIIYLLWGLTFGYYGYFGLAIASFVLLILTWGFVSFLKGFLEKVKESKYQNLSSVHYSVLVTFNSNYTEGYYWKNFTEGSVNYWVDWNGPYKTQEEANEAGRKAIDENSN